MPVSYLIVIYMTERGRESLQSHLSPVADPECSRLWFHWDSDNCAGL